VLTLKPMLDLRVEEKEAENQAKKGKQEKEKEGLGEETPHPIEIILGNGLAENDCRLIDCGFQTLS